MINGTCMSASTSRGAMGFFRANFVFLARSANFFFSPPKSEYFSATMGIRLFKKKKTYPTPLKLIGRSLKIKNHKGIKTVLNYLTKTSFGVVLRRRDFVCLTKKYCIKIAINIS
jgi:hypothetical protein